MEDNSGDQKVIDLLSKLKNDQNAYPAELLELRRRKYLQQAVRASWAVGAGVGLKNTLKAGGTRLAPTAGSWLEAALVVAIVAEISTAAYIYRHRLVNLFETVGTTPEVQQVTSLPIITSALPVTEISVVPTATLTEIPTATFTPAPSVTGDNNSSNNIDENNESSNDPGGGNTQAAATPAPNENNRNNGNNGNHFGQTKQPPQATKEPNGTKVPKTK